MVPEQPLTKHLSIFDEIPSDERLYLQQLQSWIEQKIGICFLDENKHILYGRLRQLCQKQNLPHLKELWFRLNSQPSGLLGMKIAEAVATNHTYFFREPNVLDYFTTKVVPTFSPQQPFRIWSAASSSGQEAYSIAMLLSETWGEYSLDNVQILGTDISDAILRQAESGCYEAEAVKLLDPLFLERYFTPVNNQYQIAQSLIDLCTFRRLNLMARPWPFQQQFHVIFCRNVMYYFSPEQQQDLVNALYEVTAPGGYLFTSLTETLSLMKHPWQTISPGVHHKKRV